LTTYIRFVMQKAELRPGNVKRAGWTGCVQSDRSWHTKDLERKRIMVWMKKN